MNPMTIAPLKAIASGSLQDARGYPIDAKDYSRGSDGVIRRTSPKAPSRRDNIRAGLHPKNRFS